MVFRPERACPRRRLWSSPALAFLATNGSEQPGLALAESLAVAERFVGTQAAA
jgi:hypothetical protein